MLLGLVGKPSSGKSTFFQSATMVSVPRASYPFTTIDPNRGIGYVRIKCVDSEFNVKCNPRTGYCIAGNRFVPVELLDVAGLVPGAHLGKGLGNKFLDDLRKADALIHIVDASGSTDEKGEPLSLGFRDPSKDIEFLEEELGLWVYNILKRGFDRVKKEQDIHKLSSEDALSIPLTGLGVSSEKIKPLVYRFPERLAEWTDADLKKAAFGICKVSKPIVIAANKCDISYARDNVGKLMKKYPDRVIIPTSAETELLLREAAKSGYIKYIPGDKEFKIVRPLNEKQKAALDLASRVIDTLPFGTGIQKVLNTVVFDVLKYVAVFPGGVHKLEDKKGNVLPDVFLMPPGSTAKDFALSIHSDLGDKFIKAIDVRTKKPLGANYVLRHRDVLEIVFGR